MLHGPKACPLIPFLLATGILLQFLPSLPRLLLLSHFCSLGMPCKVSTIRVSEYVNASRKLLIEKVIDRMQILLEAYCESPECPASPNRLPETPEVLEPCEICKSAEP